MIFLAEAFTRPKVMHRLAKLGFSQSYTYFTWRNTKEELTEYFTELTQGPGPRVLPPERLAQHAGHPARSAADRRRGAVQGAAGAGRDAGRQLRHVRPGLRAAGTHRRAARPARNTSIPRSTSCATGTGAPDSGLRPFIARVNQIRHDNKALHADHSLRFLAIDNDHLIAYVKARPTAATSS